VQNQGKTSEELCLTVIIFSFHNIFADLEELANTLRDCQLRERSRRGLTTFVRA
jgi:hypothetical protein